MVSAPLFTPGSSQRETLQQPSQLVDRLLLLGLQGHEGFDVLVVLGHDRGGLPGVVVVVVRFGSFRHGFINTYC